MGIGFVLLFWAAVGLGLAIVGAFFARRITASLLPRNKDGSNEIARQRTIRYATVLPFACLFWAAAVFFFQGYINTNFLHRDMGLGDAFYCPLPNGYSILMVDVGDRGTVYNPKTQRGAHGFADQWDTISGVRKLQVAGPELLGGADSRYAEHFGENNPPLDRYFLLDTRTGHSTDFPTENALRIAASNRGINLKLKPIYSVYRRYRVTWFDFLAVCVLFVPPVIAFALLLRSIARLKHGQNSP